MGRSRANRAYRSRATSLWRRKASWMKGLMGSSGQLLGGDGLEARGERMVHGKGDQVGEAADREQEGISRGRVEMIEDPAREPREQHSADGAGHAPEADHGTD